MNPVKPEFHRLSLNINLFLKTIVPFDSQTCHMLLYPGTMRSLSGISEIL
jgi:hypothetical protein